MLESLEFERNREAALAEQLEEIVVEGEGPAIDEEAFARMAPEDVELVRASLESPSFDLFGDEESLYPQASEDNSEDDGSLEEEIARLEEEIAASRRRQRAFERYLEALGED